MQQMLDGIGWVMDEGGKVTKNPDSSATSDPYYPTNPSLFYIDRLPSKVSSTAESLCKLLDLTYLKEGSLGFIVLTGR